MCVCVWDRLCGTTSSISHSMRAHDRPIRGPLRLGFLDTQYHACLHRRSRLKKLVAAPLFVKLSKRSTSASTSTSPARRNASSCIAHHRPPFMGIQVLSSLYVSLHGATLKARFLPQPHRLLPHQSKTGRSQARRPSFPKADCRANPRRPHHHHKPGPALHHHHVAHKTEGPAAAPGAGLVQRDPWQYHG